MTTPAERFAALTPKEQERLRLLNEKLWAAEEWIRQRHARGLEWYYGAGGLRRHGEALFEDVETEVVVRCILREDHPGWKESDDNIVATLLHPGACLDEDNPRRNWNEYQHWDGHLLQGQYHCRIFHDLCDHVLDYDWDALLGIGEVWTDLMLIQQRIESW